jgi:hypothetical protein
MVADLSLCLSSRFGAATGPGVMAAIKGNIGAETGFSPVVFFCRRRVDQKKMLEVPDHGEGSHLLDEPGSLKAVPNIYSVEPNSPVN